MSIGDIAVSAEQPRPRLGRHRRIEQPPEHVVGRRRLQVHRRRQDLHVHGASHVAHINRIVIDPRNNDIVFVAATGQLLRARRRARRLQDDRRRQDLEAGAEGRRRHRRERSRDGSDEHQVLYASTYQRRRTACCMNGGGPGSGIWKSTDGGETWTRLKTRPSRRIARPHRPRRLPASAPTFCTRSIEGPVQPAAARTRRRGGAGEEGARARAGAGAAAAGGGAAARQAAAAQSERSDRALSLGRCAARRGGR